MLCPLLCSTLSNSSPQMPQSKRRSLTRAHSPKPGPDPQDVVLPHLCSPGTLPLTPSTPASLLLLRLPRPTPATRRFFWPFPLPGKFFPQMSVQFHVLPHLLHVFIQISPSRSSICLTPYISCNFPVILGSSSTFSSFCSQHLSPTNTLLRLPSVSPSLLCSNADPPRAEIFFFADKAPKVMPGI